VSATWEGDRHLLSFDGDQSLALDEVPMKFGGVALFESAELAREHGVEGIGDHGEGHIELDLEQNGRRDSVEVEELHCLCDPVFDAPATGIVADQQLDLGIEVVRDEEGRLLAAVAADDDLTQFAVVSFQ
jgi:hypothetical protein